MVDVLQVVASLAFGSALAIALSVRLYRSYLLESGRLLAHLEYKTDWLSRYREGSL